MASHRLALIFLLVAVSGIYAYTKQNHLIVGSRLPGDFLLQREIVKKPSSFLQIVKLKKTFTGNNYHNITQVRLLDQNKSGNGAVATIVNGGPSHNFVTVEFKSKRNHNIDFIVEIYGK